MDYAQLKPGKGFNPIQSFMYYLQRSVTWRLPRRIAMRCIRATVTHRSHLRHGLRMAPATASANATTLAAKGHTALGQLLDATQVEEIHAYLADKILFGRGPHAGPMTLQHRSEGVGLADYELQDVIDCPHLLALANSVALLDLASSYLDCAPTISALALRWSFPRAAKADDLQTFHRDADDWKFLKVFVYLTDVDCAAGPHVFVEGTHLQPMPLRLKMMSDEYVIEHFGAEKLKSFTGTSGFGFAVDTAGIHKGEVPRSSARLMLTIQYSMLPYYGYLYRPRKYRGPLALNRYVNRLIVD